MSICFKDFYLKNLIPSRISKFGVCTDTTVSPAPNNVAGGGALCYDGGSYVYTLRGNGTNNIWRFDISDNSWVSMANTPNTVSMGGALAYAVGIVYAFRGGNTNAFWRYNIGTDTWTTTLAQPVLKIDAGGDPLCPDPGYAIYGLRGGSTTSFWQYSTLSK